MTSLQKSGLKLSDLKLLHLAIDLRSALGRSVGHCLVRASPSASLRLDKRFHAFRSALECLV